MVSFLKKKPLPGSKGYFMGPKDKVNEGKTQKKSLEEGGIRL